MLKDPPPSLTVPILPTVRVIEETLPYTRNFGGTYRFFAEPLARVACPVLSSLRSVMVPHSSGCRLTYVSRGRSSLLSH